MKETFLIQNILSGQAYEYVSSLMEDLETKFRVQTPRRHNFDPHFTLKYKFDTEDYTEIEEKIREFALKKRRAKVKLLDIGTFKGGEVIYIKVNVSDEAEKLFVDFYTYLENKTNIEWTENDRENLNFHITLAVQCKNKSEEIISYLKNRQRFVDTYLDNLSILKLTSTEAGNNLWSQETQILIPN